MSVISSAVFRVLKEMSRYSKRLTLGLGLLPYIWHRSLRPLLVSWVGKWLYKIVLLTTPLFTPNSPHRPPRYSRCLSLPTGTAKGSNQPSYQRENGRLQRHTACRGKRKSWHLHCTGWSIFSGLLYSLRYRSSSSSLPSHCSIIMSSRLILSGNGRTY